MITRWIPIEERSTFMARSFFGSVAGLVITFPLCGHLSESYGWPSAYYVIGTISVIWFISWWFLVYDTPEKHPRIDESERSHIMDKLRSTASGGRPVPVRAILTSLPVWAMIISDCGNGWGLTTLGTNGPTYLKTMLGIGGTTNSYISAAPMLCRYLGGLVSGAIADRMITRK